MENLILLKYNNYFNRIIKKEATIYDYIDGRNCAYLTNVSFIPADGIRTTQIVNWKEYWIPDYCIVVSEDNQIISRWFIMESNRTRGSQYRLSLKRDVLVDFYQSIITAPAFIEKGFVNIDNPLIFNAEDFLCNQIKKNEIALCDKWKNVGWYAIFYDKNLDSSNDADNPLLGNFSTIDPTELNIIETTYAYADLPSGLKEANFSGYAIALKSLAGNGLTVFVNRNGEIYKADLNRRNSELIILGGNIVDTLNVNATLNNDLDTFVADQSNISMLWDGRIIKTTDNRYFEVSIDRDVSEVDEVVPATGTLKTEMESRFAPGGVLVPGFNGSVTNAMWVNQIYKMVKVNYREITEFNGTYDLRATSGKNITNAPYGVVLLPFCDINVIPYPNALPVYASLPLGDAISKSIVNEVLRKAATSTSSIYDVQIVPYCPVDIPLIGNEANLLALESNYYSTITDNNSNNVLFAIHPYNIQFSRNLSDVGIIPPADLPEERKVNNQCTFYRLTSPNFNGQFEFTAEKNLGVQGYNIDITLKPYQSYIHINPIFNGLYGKDYNDPRGLVFGGDFSLTRTVDQWENYKLQNKNYEKIFDRQIQNMETMRAFDRVGDIVGAFTGSFSAVGKGALVGTMLGNNPIAGGAIGGGASLAGGVADILMNEARYQENKNYATDMHNYSLANIRALPTSLSKVDALNGNFKIFPILEEFTCTDVEKAIFRSKIKYEGMTVNAIGTISDYIKPDDLTFIRCQMIRADIDEDTHFYDDIYLELKKGAYFYG